MRTEHFGPADSYQDGGGGAKDVHYQRSNLVDNENDLLPCSHHQAATRGAKDEKHELLRRWCCGTERAMLLL